VKPRGEPYRAISTPSVACLPFAIASAIMSSRWSLSGLSDRPPIAAIIPCSPYAKFAGKTAQIARIRHLVSL
jgi:hypothetical protein